MGTVLVALVIILLQFLLQRWRSNEASDNEERDNIVDNVLESSSNATVATTSDEARHEEQSTRINTESTSVGEMQVMLEYLKSLQNYKKLCATVFLQRWFRKMQRKRIKENTKKR